MPVFDGLDLAESFILAWNMHDGSLSFDVDFVLSPHHPRFTGPAPGEWACFKRGTLVFPQVRQISGLRSMGDVRGAVDALGERDFGNFDTLLERKAGSFEVSGGFGDIVFDSADPVVEIGR